MISQQAKGTLGAEVMDAVRGEGRSRYFDSSFDVVVNVLLLTMPGVCSGVEEAAIAPPEVSLKSITE